ncbi:MAG: hypothetical protein Q8R24_06395 [Legionellaceae bacterium]|nr:hypothetical protein [Legionellaceae bacterium]
MPLRALQTLIPNVPWIPYSHGQHTRTYLSAHPVTINGFTAQWELESPYSYGVILLTHYPSPHDRIQLQQQNQPVFIRVDKQLCFLNPSYNTIINMTENELVLAEIDDYLSKADLLSHTNYRKNLTLLDIKTLSDITDLNTFDYLLAGAPSLYIPQRLVEIWNTVNPGIPAYDLHYAWLSPHMIGKPVSQNSIATYVINYYRQHRVIIFDPFDNTMIDCNNTIVCKKVANALQHGTTLGDHNLRKLQDPNSELNRKLLERNSTEQNSPIVQCIGSLLYITKELAFTDIINDYITPAIFEKLFFFRQLGRQLTVPILSILVDIAQIEHQDTHHPTSEQKFNVFRKVSERIHTNVLMYIVNEKPHLTSGFLKNLKPDQIKYYITNRNIDYKNALDQALMSSSKARDAILQASSQLTTEDQRELLSHIANGRYHNIFEYTATEYPHVYNLIHCLPIWSSQREHVRKMNDLLIDQKFNILMNSLHQELLECRTEQPYSAKLNELEASYQALLKIKYHLFFSTKPLNETHQLFKKQCLSAFTIMDSNLIQAHYYWEQNQFTSLFLKPKLAFINLFKETKSRISRLQVAVEHLSIQEDSEFVVISTQTI